MNHNHNHTYQVNGMTHYTSGNTGGPNQHNHAVPDPNNAGMFIPSQPMSGSINYSWEDVKRMVAEAVAWHTAEIEELRQHIDDLEVELEVANNDFHNQQGFKSGWTEDRRGDPVPPPILPKHWGIFTDAEKN